MQALSVTLRKQTLDGAMRNVGRLKAAVDRCKETDAQRLTNEYKRLVGGLQVRPCSLRSTASYSTSDHSRPGSASVKVGRGMIMPQKCLCEMCQSSHHAASKDTPWQNVMRGL